MVLLSKEKPSLEPPNMTLLSIIILSKRQYYSIRIPHTYLTLLFVVKMLMACMKS